MDWKKEWKPLVILAALFAGFYWLPVDSPRFTGSLIEALALAKWYAREHVLLCLVPAFFIAGAISVFVSQASVMKYLGARANKTLAYGVASVSGTVLAVCSCTVLPLFAGIYRMGAGLGPATAFLYSGPAINVLAIILTARVLGLEMGIARAVGAVVFSIVIGLVMHFIFRREELEKASAQAALPEPEAARPLWQNSLFFAAMVGILVFANWGSGGAGSGLWQTVYGFKWWLTGFFALSLGVMLVLWFGLRIRTAALIGLSPSLLAVGLPTLPVASFGAGALGLSVAAGQDRGELGQWFKSTWEFAKQILPLLFLGVLFAGVFLGRPGHEGLIPSGWIASAVGGNSLGANLFASFAGALMYFATLTEVPILQGLIGSGMGKGPALALLLAGPALSLPSMLVLRNIMGTRKTIVYVALVVTMATLSGWLYGSFF